MADLLNHFPNVEVDKNSCYSFDQVNERDFILGILTCLRNRMGVEFENYTFYLFFNHDPTILPRSISKINTQKILFYFSDESSHNPIELTSYYQTIFKSYLKNEDKENNIFPFPLGHTNGVDTKGVKNFSEREITVFFSGSLKKNRIALYKALIGWDRVPEFYLHILLKIWNFRLLNVKFLRTDFSKFFENSYIKFTSSFKSGLDPQTYSRMLENSLIALCPKGFQSPETFRHFEALQMGCVVISESLPDLFFYRSPSIIQIENWEVGFQRCKELLQNQDELLNLHQQAQKWYKDVLSEEALAKYISDQIQKSDELIST